MVLWTNTMIYQKYEVKLRRRVNNSYACFTAHYSSTYRFMIEKHLSTLFYQNILQSFSVAFISICAESMVSTNIMFPFVIKCWMVNFKIIFLAQSYYTAWTLESDLIVEAWQATQYLWDLFCWFWDKVD